MIGSNTIDWEYKVFRDIVHGYIEIPKPLVKLFIDTPIFQRLRNVEQTGMRVLYPAARHDRFIHSLGTYYLGVKAFSALKRNIKSSANVKKYFNVKKPTKTNDLFWNKYEVLFQIACLMHDCAHAPFSHTLEYIYNLKTEFELDAQLISIINHKDFESDLSGVTPKEHEYTSAIIIKKYYSDAIEEILDTYVVDGKISEEELNECIEFIIRAITGTKYISKKDLEHQVLNCFISLLNSNIDVDGLDYIIRDSKLSGIDNYSIDVDRLLGSINVVEVTDLKEQYFTNQQLNHVVMKLDDGTWATFKGKFDGFAKGELQADDFSGSFKGHVSLKDSYGTLEGDIIKKDYSLAEIGGSTYINPITIPAPDNSVKFLFSGDTKFAVRSANIRTRPDFNATIKSDSSNISTKSLKINAKLTGTFTGRMLGKFEGYDSSIIIGYHKSSLNVIENVIHARNYEYLWIYGHHKVVYYSNYLIKELLHKASNLILSIKGAKYIFPSIAKAKDSYDIITNLMSISSFSNDTLNAESTNFLVNDNDILTFFKNVFFLNNQSKTPDVEYQKLYNELQTRIYKHSVWKSPAEYNILLSDLSQAEKESLYSHLKNSYIKKSKDTKKHKKQKYGNVPPDWQEEFDNYGMHNVIWVESTVTFKNLIPDETFILFKDTPVRFRDAVFNASNSELNLTEYEFSGFYLYYSGKLITKQQLEMIGSFLSAKAKEYSSSI